jgi:hypothetical protein
VLRKIIGHKEKEVTGGWRRLHREELYDPSSPPNIIRAKRMKIFHEIWCMFYSYFKGSFRWVYNVDF